MSKPIDKKASPEPFAEVSDSAKAGDKVKASPPSATPNAPPGKVSPDQTARSDKDKPPPKVSESKTVRRLASLAAVMTSIRSIVTNGVILILLIALIITAALEVRQRTTVLDPIQVPKDLADRGYSPEVVAQRLNDEIETVINEGSNFSPASTNEKHLNHGVIQRSKYLPNAERPDIDVPISGISIRNAVRYVRYALGSPETHIGGNISREGEQMQLVLRTSGQATTPLVILMAAKLEDLLALGAQEVVKSKSPLLLAGYLYNHKDKDPDFTRTEAALRYSLEKQPTESPAWAYFLWGEVLSKRNSLQEALEKYQKATEIDPYDAESYNNWGNALSGLGRHVEAIEKYKKVTELLPAEAVPYSNWCNELAEIGNPEAGIEKCRKATELSPNYAPASHNWGVALERLKRYDEAIEKYRKAIDIDPKLSLSYLGWGIVLDRLGKYAEAIEQYKQSTELDPKSATAYLDWGIALDRLGKYAEAIEQYKKATELDPKNAVAYLDWGIALDNLKKDNDAIERFEKATEIDPKLSDAYERWGTVLSKLKKQDEAQAKFAKARELRGY